MSQSTLSDRRTHRPSTEASAVDLVHSQLAAAQRQLAEAREALIAARRRVVALEEVVENWTEFSRTAETRLRSNGH